jgi:hypothetical protein
MARNTVAFCIEIRYLSYGDLFSAPQPPIMRILSGWLAAKALSSSVFRAGLLRPYGVLCGS